MTLQESYIANIRKTIEIENETLIKERQMFNEGQILLQEETYVIKLENDLISSINERLKKVVNVLLSLEKDKRLANILSIPGSMSYFDNDDRTLIGIKEKRNELYRRSSDAREKNHVRSAETHRENLKVLNSGLIDGLRAQNESEKKPVSLDFKSIIENLKVLMSETTDKELKEEIQKHINYISREYFEHLKTFKLNKGA